MKKINISLALAVAVVLAGPASASAATMAGGVSTTNTISVNHGSQGSSMSATSSGNLHMTGNGTSSNDLDVKGNATSSARNHGQMGSSTSVSMKENASTSMSNVSTTATSTHGSINSQAHKSPVALFVQNLLKIADREEGIGEEVRLIAHAQNDSDASTTEEMEKVETRGGFKTFFIGSDYENLGKLRSEFVKTENQLAKLKSLVVNATNDEDKVELNTEIKALENNQVKINQFITTNESKFSLFGWFVKLFN